MPQTKFNPKTSPLDQLRLSMVEQTVGKPRSGHFRPDAKVDPWKIEGRNPLQKEAPPTPGTEPLARMKTLPDLINELGLNPMENADLPGVGAALHAAAPLGGPAKKALRELPAIAPEAYRDVKAGGLKLYSRLTDAFAKTPDKAFHPDKVRSIAKSGASTEEVGLRKLEDFLKMRDPGAQIPREDIMGHLEQNPLELDIVRKGKNVPKSQEVAETPDPQAELDQLTHELDTRYGANWVTPQQQAGGVRADIVITHEEAQRLIDLILRTNEYNVENLRRQYSIHRLPTDTRWETILTPGPKENYGETLINAPAPKLGAKIGPIETVPPDEVLYGVTHRADVLDENGEWIGERITGDSPERVIENAAEAWANPKQVFQSGHWNEPNNLVWSRHSERYLEPDYVPPRGRGRLTEEIQSDLHQKGRKYGYRTPEIEAEYAAGDERSTELNAQMNDMWDDMYQASQPVSDTNRYDPDIHESGFGNTKEVLDAYEKDPAKYQHLLTPQQGETLDNYLKLRTEERAINDRQYRDKPLQSMVPDFPYKDTYHELGLKASVLDSANDPNSEWFGVSDAATNAAMEGHGRLAAGTQSWYDEKHPSALSKMMNPFGVEVKHEQLPFNTKEASFPIYENFSVANRPNPTMSEIVGPETPRPLTSRQAYTPPRGTQRVVDLGTSGKGTHVADVLPRGYPGINISRDGSSPLPREVERTVIDPISRRLYGKPASSEFLNAPTKASKWGWNWDPETKRKVAERGFPAMAALLALQKSNVFSGEEKQMPAPIPPVR